MGQAWLADWLSCERMPTDRESEQALFAAGRNELVAVQKALTCEKRDCKGLHASPSNITRGDLPITRDYTPFLLTSQGTTLRLQGITRLSC